MAPGGYDEESFYVHGSDMRDIRSGRFQPIQA
jgi:hypothetical protein